MKKLQFKVSINAPATKVYDIMLGISNKSTYEQWTAMFNPTSTFEGNWVCLLYTSPSPRDRTRYRMPSSD